MSSTACELDLACRSVLLSYWQAREFSGLVRGCCLQYMGPLGRRVSEGYDDF